MSAVKRQCDMCGDVFEEGEGGLAREGKYLVCRRCYERDPAAFRFRMPGALCRVFLFLCPTDKRRGS